MRILLTTQRPDAVSSKINIPNFLRINDIKGVSIDLGGTEYAEYDFILFMGYDPRIAEARAVNPSAKIGIIDPRPGNREVVNGADFIIANGPEMRDFFADQFANIFLYPIYTEVPAHTRQHKAGPIRIGYHGNKVNLQLIAPHISGVLNILGGEHEIELAIFYNKEMLGPLDFPVCDINRVKLTTIQFREAELANFARTVDIGIVPNIIPTAPLPFDNNQPRLYNEHPSDYLTRYKATANAGRIFLFAQNAIPVIAGPTPSAAQLITDGESGFLPATPGGWYNALNALIQSPELRQTMGGNLQRKVADEFAIDILNKRLVEQFKNYKDKTAFRDKASGMQPALKPPLTQAPSKAQRFFNTLKRFGSSRLNK